ncbi:MAG: peptide-binding protein [FCB group bacterium]|jgi:peptide/nickel transport system substrate-binding protein|nr:peptide-binding protein [FCB group bacterium]
MKRSAFRIAGIGLVAVLGLLATGCGPGGGGKKAGSDDGVTKNRITATIPGTPVDGDWVVSRLPLEMAHLNPLVSNDAYGRAIYTLIYESLLERDNATLQLGPGLAESHEISPDHLTYTFKLRDGIKFSDGAPLTAEDVKFSFDKLMDPAVDAADLRNYFLTVDRCEVVDPLTVRFVCKEPYFKMLITLGEDLKIVPKHIFETGDFNTHPNNRKPIGSGPYVMDSWDTNRQIVLSRNENYWGKKPHILKRVYKIITDDNAALQVLERGDLDTMGLTAEQWDRRAKRPEFEAQFDKLAYYTPFHSYIGWNTRQPQLSDKRVRRALTMLLNRELILDKIFYGMGVVVSNSFFIESNEYNKDLKPLPFSPADAKRLLDDAGWKDTNGDGVRDKDGIPLRFEFLLVANSPDAEQLATVFQEELKKAGIEMSIRPLEWATFIDSIQKRKFDACMLGWQLDPEQDPYQIWHSSQSDEGSNYPGFKNAEADKIIEDARREFDPAKRAEMYHRLSVIIDEEQPYTFLFCTKARAAIDKRFRNVQAYPLGLDAREWWVPAELQKRK